VLFGVPKHLLDFLKREGVKHEQAACHEVLAASRPLRVFRCPKKCGATSWSDFSFANRICECEEELEVRCPICSEWFGAGNQGVMAHVAKAHKDGAQGRSEIAKTPKAVTPFVFKDVREDERRKRMVEERNKYNKEEDRRKRMLEEKKRELEMVERKKIANKKRKVDSVKNILELFQNHSEEDAASLAEEVAKLVDECQVSGVYEELAVSSLLFV
jgi:hypothetical protein